MTTIQASATDVISAPPAVVYGVLADYREGHPAILPPKYFRALEVESGGLGDGTRIRVQVRSFGRVQTFRAVISEPERGRRLVETDPEQGIVTTFTVEPADDGRRAQVTIATRYEKPGLAGRLEGLVAPAALRTVYAAVLRQLDAVARDRTPRRTD